MIEELTAPRPPAFALLYRPDTSGPAVVEAFVGSVSAPDTLAEIPLGDDPVLALVPYRQIAERGFASPDDGTPLVALRATRRVTLPLDEALDALPDEPITLSGGHFDPDDDTYAATVRRIVRDEIGQGEGANFVFRRSFVADLAGDPVRAGLTLFRRLIRGETGAYWTFVVYTGSRVLVGASPERHISVVGGRAVMNPISGTYRYPETGPTVPGVLEFLADRKEADELYMVVDEELKMMARICRAGGRVRGPYLKEMARLAHTEYLIDGETDLDPREILRETMFAPTVTGSPLESAARVIARYEPRGRAYYAGALALLDRDDAGARRLDSAILIRSADITFEGQVRIGVGATLVRHSDPASEVAETRAKASSLIAALEDRGPRPLPADPAVRGALARRNATIADFWLAGGRERHRPDPRLAGRRVLVVDAEDNFTSMIDHQLRALGLTVTVVRFDEPFSFDGHDLVIMGPGPGDPRDITQSKTAVLRSCLEDLLSSGRRFMAVCLSHQVLCTLLDLPLRRRTVPNQGVQREIDFFGRREVVGFYNTFAAHSVAQSIDRPGIGTVAVSRDPATGEVHGLRGRRFVSMQFHAESLLTRDGIRLFDALLGDLLGESDEVPPPTLVVAGGRYPHSERQSSV